MDFSLRPVPFQELEGWEDDDPSSLFAVMARCLDHIRTVKPYRTGSLGVTADDLAVVFADAAERAPDSPAAARGFFEQSFQPFRIVPSNGGDGFVTAFYEPEVEVSRTRSEAFRFPFYRRPADLIDIDDTNRPEGFDPAYAFARQTKEGIGYYPRREAIDRGCLEGMELEIAWARSRVDVFFAHVQGAARLCYPNGSIQRITYAAKAGHPFTGIGRYLADIGEIPLPDVSMQSIRAWFAAHPDRMDEVLWQNRSYIFFREAQVDDPSLGPVAAAKVPLEAMRSLAVDRLIHTFSTPFFIRSDTLTHLTGGKPFARLMLALDTGSAIVGPARGDIFTGSGFEAGELAGNVRNAADFTILIPKTAAARFGR
ncbi:MAG: murein transglycosylase A [Rhizobium sp.]|nr:murein transglycosylase A [Rhizobium sp.]